MGKIRWSSEAFSWLKKIYDYIATDNPEAAHRTVKGISQRVKNLADHPEMGCRLYNYPKKNIRVLLYGHYRIAYEIDPHKNINLLGIFHGALDLKKYLSLKK